MKRVFISYDIGHDKEWKERLAEQMNHPDLVVEDGRDAGSNWEVEMQRAVGEADVVVLLMTAKYFNSKEFDTVHDDVDRRVLKGLPTFPLIVKPCSWAESSQWKWLAEHRQLRPQNRQALSLLDDARQDAGLEELAAEVFGTLGLRRVRPRELSPRPRPESELLRTVKEDWLNDYLTSEEVGIHFPVRRRLSGRTWEEDLPQEKSAFEALRENGDELLILGGPGSGKTAELIRIAERAVAEALLDAEKPIPVILRLSRWDDSDTFEEWLIRQLHDVYYVRGEQVCARWARHGKLMLLIDQLEQVGWQRMDRCIGLIRSYVNKAGHGGIAVCCRDGSYRQCDADLGLRATLELLPFSRDQVVRSFAEHNGDLAALRGRWNDGENWKEALSTPRYLGLAFSALRGFSDEDLPEVESSPVEIRRFLDESFVRRSLERVQVKSAQDDRKTYKREEMVRWFAWLAERMAAADFYFEDIQPRGWLDRRPDRWLYVFLSRLVPGLAIGLSSWRAPGLALGVLTGVGVGFVDAWRFGRDERVARSLGRGYFYPLALLSMVALGWLSLSVFRGEVPFTLATKLLDGYLGAVLMAYFAWRGRRRSPGRDVIPVDRLRFRPKWNGWGLLPGVLFIVGLWFFSSIDDQRGFVWSLIFTMILGFPLTVVGAVVGSFLAGLRVAESAGAKKKQANLRIFQSAFTGLGAALAVMLAPALYWLFVFFVAMLKEAPGVADVVAEVTRSFIFVLPVAVAMALACGVADAGQHYVLRWILWRRNCLPWRLGRFLNKAAETVVVRRAGRAFIFPFGYLRADLRDRYDGLTKAP